MTRGLFISFEGTDGTGKSTQIELLRRYFQEAGQECVYLREPGGTAIGERVREVLLDNRSRGMTARTEALLYAASRAQLVETVIEPALETGKNVICDRYVDSSYAYQEFGRDLGSSVVDINEFATGGLMPDMTLLLMLDRQAARERMAARGGEADRIENEGDAFMEKVAAGYLKVAKRYPDRIRVIDASKAPEEIAAEIRSEVEMLQDRKTRAEGASGARPGNSDSEELE
ncbi:MAG: dTMP kinase [Eubacteriales bacterium]|nr:dTMP kinase [Eubacteriales bacterium]